MVLKNTENAIHEMFLFKHLPLIELYLDLAQLELMFCEVHHAQISMSLLTSMLAFTGASGDQWSCHGLHKAITITITQLLSYSA